MIWRPDRGDTLLGAGSVLLILGTGMAWLPLGIIVAALILLAWGILTEMGGARGNPK